MTTINGVSFNMKELDIVAIHRNIPGEQPGHDGSSVSGMGYAGLVLRLIGFENTLAEYDAVIKEFMKTGEQTLVHRTGWQFKIHSTLLIPIYMDGSEDHHFPYELVLVTGTPYRESTSMSCRAKEITTNNQEWTAEDIACGNLVDNWNFEDWSAGTSSPPDGWIKSGTGNISRDDTVEKVGTYCMKMDKTTTAILAMHQDFPDWQKYVGVEMTFGAWVKTSITNQVRIYIDDWAGSTVDYHTGSGDWEWLEVTRTIHSNAQHLKIYIQGDFTAGDIYADGAVLIVGDKILDNTFIRDINTSGSVDAVPDIQVIGGDTSVNITQDTTDSNYNSNAGNAGVTITQAVSTNCYIYNLWGQTVNCRKAGMAVIDSVQFWLYLGILGGSATVTCEVYDGVGGNLLGSKAITITDQTPQYRTFTFPTPIIVVQAEDECTDAVDTDKIYFRVTFTGNNVNFCKDNAGGYADGDFYDFNENPTGDSMRFILTGHSCKQIEQSFTVDNTIKVSKVTLNMCKYNYAGSNAVTVKIKEGATVLGTGTAVLSGSTFAEVDFILEEETAHSLELSSGTTYDVVITPPSDSVNATSILVKTKTSNVYADGAVTLVENGDTDRVQTHDLYFIMEFAASNLDVDVYNTADTTVKCSIVNSILEGATHRINVDGTGSVDYDDDFDTDKCLVNNEGMSGVTHDSVNDEIDIADDGYIFWKCDTKYPVTGIPTLTARIDNTAATLPTIQISSDGSTWYDITDVVVDNVKTVYELDSSSLTLDGLSLFYWRFDCSAAAVTQGCSVKNFELDVNMITIDAEHPVIPANGVSTVKCNQDSDSGMLCRVALSYRDRSWSI